MTFYRALGYVDRAAMRDGSPLRVVMASEGRQADGIDLRMSGAKLDRYRSNPVLGYGHNYWGRENLPIGRIVAESIKVDGTQLSGDLDFDDKDSFAQLCEQKMRDGYLSAVSIGFDVVRWEDPKSNYWTGGVAEEWELSELSVVPIGMDANALVTAGRSLTGVPDTELLTLLRAMAHRLGVEPNEGEAGPTINEWRARNGLPHVAWGDVQWVPASQASTTAQAAPERAAQEPIDISAFLASIEDARLPALAGALAARMGVTPVEPAAIPAEPASEPTRAATTEPNAGDLVAALFKEIF